MTPDQIKRASAAIRDGKTAVNEKTGIRGRARVRGGEGAARKSVRLLHAVLSWAVDEGLAKTNPAASVKTGADGKGDPLRQSASPPMHEEKSDRIWLCIVVWGPDGPLPLHCRHGLA